MSDDGFELDACEIRHLSPQQWTALRRRIIERAREERHRVLGQIAASGFGALRLACRVARGSLDASRKAWRHHPARRERAQALRELSAMNDRELRDIGITRLEIWAAVRSDCQAAVEPPVPTFRRREPHAESLLDCSRLGAERGTLS